MTDFCSMFVSKVSSLLLGPINGLFIPSPENSIVSLLYFVPNSRSNGKMGTANRVHYRGTTTVLYLLHAADTQYIVVEHFPVLFSYLYGARCSKTAYMLSPFSCSGQIYIPTVKGFRTLYFKWWLFESDPYLVVQLTLQPLLYTKWVIVTPHTTTVCVKSGWCWRWCTYCYLNLFCTNFI